MIASPVFGAPGVYVAPERTVPALAGVRLDVCAFAGVAPRGPARVPDASPDPLPAGSTLRLPRRRSVAVPVGSFAEYRRLYGGFEGPGRLPFAVAAFFEQGGRRAWVVRVVHEYGGAANEGGVAHGVLAGVAVAGTAAAVTLAARDEGRWGNRLRAAIGFSARPLRWVERSAAAIDLDTADRVPPGTLLRCALPGGGKAWAVVAGLVRLESAGEEGVLRAVLDRVLPDVPVAVEVVEGTLVVDDGAGFVERHAGLGFSPLHPRWIAAVLCHESDLVFPATDWDERDLVPAGPAETVRFGEPVLPPPETLQLAGGEDRFQDLVPDDFFDSGWTLGDEQPGSGVHALVGLPEVATVAVPDLYSPEPLEPQDAVVEEVSLATGEFAPCDDFAPPAEVQEAPPPGLDGLWLDPETDFDAIVELQGRLVRLAEDTGGFVVLLDVPPGLAPARIRTWRSRFRSSWAAAYHPWLRVARPDDPRDRRDRLILLPPSAVAAGAIARRELTAGVPHGPWGEVAAGVLAVAQPVPPALHAELHPTGINVFQPERDGVVLWGGRTLSRDALWRQLSVRRLAMLLRRTLERETQWLVFEPNGPALWAEVRSLLWVFLRRLHLQGAFAGATEEQAFFVRCDATTTPPRLSDQGQVIVEVGFAPAEPLEFVVLRLVRGGDGTLTVEE